MVTTACDYGVVGCGYKASTWPVGTEGGAKASENALGVDYPVAVLSGNWISPNMLNVMQIDRAAHNVVVIADKDSKVVNVGGDYSVMGGTLS